MTAPTKPKLHPIKLAPANEALTADALIAKSIAKRPPESKPQGVTMADQLQFHSCAGA